MGVPVTPINKLGEGSPHVVDLIRERRCDLVINTPTGSGARADGYEIRTAAVRHGHPLRDDDDRRLRRRARDRRRKEERRRCPLAAGDPRAAAGGRRSLDDRAVGAAALRGHREPCLGRLPRLLAARRARARARSRASSTCSPPSATGRRRGGRPFLPRALSVADDGAEADGGVRLDFLIEGIGPGTDRLCELEVGEGVWVNGPLGNAFSSRAS